MAKGLSASGLQQICEASGAPIGSVYHHFPGGKAELAAATLRRAGAGYQALVEEMLDSEAEIVDGLRASFEAAAGMLVASDYADACPIATVALEVASTDDDLRQVTHEIFETWLEAAALRGRKAGLDPAAARDLAITFVAALEGGFLLSRAAKSTEPMLATGRSVVAMVQAQLAGRSTVKRSTPRRAIDTIARPDA